MSSKSTASPEVSAEPFVFNSAGENGNSGNGPGRPPSHGGDNHSAQARQEAYEKGLAEGEARVRAEGEKTLAALCGEVSETVRQFAAQRDRYFERVENEVVQLSLSIARKILHREVQIDPLLLAGIVRVALDGLNDGTQVRLRANPQEIPFWRDYFSRSPEGQAAPELLGDPSLACGSCTLETELGSTHVSLDTQLKEIEQGFLDLLEHRPRERP
jgi:flagellar assembly protein FliH